MLTKWSDPNTYEIYQVTDEAISIRYEVMCAGGVTGRDNWIRRYHEHGKPASAGQVWINRWTVPGGAGVREPVRAGSVGF